MQKPITNSALDSWATMFQDKKYHGHHFLSMVEMKGTVIAPMYANGGLWLRFVGEEVKLCTCMCRAILNLFFFFFFEILGRIGRPVAIYIHDTDSNRMHKGGHDTVAVVAWRNTHTA
jgi:hypothetical protein